MEKAGDAEVQEFVGRHWRHAKSGEFFPAETPIGTGPAGRTFDSTERQLGETLRSTARTFLVILDFVTGKTSVS